MILKPEINLILSYNNQVAKVSRDDSGTPVKTIPCHLIELKQQFQLVT